MRRNKRIREQKGEKTKSERKTRAKTTTRDKNKQSQCIASKLLTKAHPRLPQAEACRLELQLQASVHLYRPLSSGPTHNCSRPLPSARPLACQKECSPEAGRKQGNSLAKACQTSASNNQRAPPLGRSSSPHWDPKSRRWPLHCAGKLPLCLARSPLRLIALVSLRAATRRLCTAARVKDRSRAPIELGRLGRRIG